MIPTLAGARLCTAGDFKEALDFFARPTPMTYRSGRHFLQIPSPTNVADRVLRAMDRPTIDHRGPGILTTWPRSARRHEAGISHHGRSSHLSGFGYGTWEAALVNTLSAGDRVLVSETGQFWLNLWRSWQRGLAL
jgi:alanine-glyoxylate transaminase/serine-glyoxylate transaminase/serine-pyruvate transaminase